MPRALVAVRPEEPYMTANPSASPGFPQELSTLLAELFSRCSGAHSPGASPTADGEEQVNEHVHAMPLLALYHWLQMWLKTPNASPNAIPPGGTETGQRTTGLMSDPLPFYWLAQLLLLAFQEGLPPEARGVAGVIGRVAVSTTRARALRAADNSHIIPLLTVTLRAVVLLKQQAELGLLTRAASHATAHVPGPLAVSGNLSGKQALAEGVANATPDAAQFHLIKSWLHHIRLFLRRSQGSPTVVWDELMKIRLSGWQEDAAASSHQDPLHGEAQKDGGTGAGAEDSVSWLEGDGLIGIL
ncbi:hypothetical protein BJY52DRAFT_1214483 [Lactarius psammicola]|nr:hypothetical protein BJY52DRAFT_1214483 [Lactarius psammicola]